MPKKMKKFIFPGTTLIASLYFSVLFGIGIIVGYLGTDIFYKKFVKTGKINHLIFNFGRWEVHFHHWLMGTIGFFVAYFFSSLSIFWIGFFGGLIFHDIYFDRKWYRVIYKKRNIV